MAEGEISQYENETTTIIKSKKSYIYQETHKQLFYFLEGDQAEKIKTLTGEKYKF